MKNSTTRLAAKLKETIRDIPDFPKEGIVFKDITPILKDQELCNEILDSFEAKFGDQQLDAVIGIESRGFLFGFLLANRLNIPFIPVRKKGKLPADTISQIYKLEYGEAAIEIHRDAFPKGAKVLIHDDLLATGGTICAASELVLALGGTIQAYSFIISLDFLKGKERIQKYSQQIESLIDF